nr:UDP-2,3-diacylglucosamine diphosphatase [candidate division Zixibacteria bacterium]
MAIYFFSDAHLGEADKEKERIKIEKIYAFLDLVRADGEKLYILGDLFDFWFEYKNAIPKEHLQVVFHLAGLVESGMEVHYISGNHDFWLGDFLSREVGIEIHRDQVETTEQGKRILLIHGDGISPSDKGYRVLKKILRNPVNIWLYQKLPVDWGIPLARYVAGKSRTYTSGRTLQFLKDYENYAAWQIKAGYDAVIVGHLHYPIRKEIEGGVYLNTGDFIENFSYGRMENGVISLEYI